MVTTTNETCNGHCFDAALAHDSLTETNENGAPFCSNKCRLERFEQRCHCGKKYTTEPEATEEQKAASLAYLERLHEKRIELASAANTNVESVMVIIRDVPVGLWLGIQSPVELDVGDIKRKRSKLSLPDMGISFWCEPIK